MKKQNMFYPIFLLVLFCFSTPRFISLIQTDVTWMQVIGGAGIFTTLILLSHIFAMFFRKNKPLGKLEVHEYLGKKSIDQFPAAPFRWLVAYNCIDFYWALLLMSFVMEASGILKTVIITSGLLIIGARILVILAVLFLAKFVSNNEGKYGRSKEAPIMNIPTEGISRRFGADNPIIAEAKYQNRVIWVASSIAKFPKTLFDVMDRHIYSLNQVKSGPVIYEHRFMTENGIVRYAFSYYRFEEDKPDDYFEPFKLSNADLVDILKRNFWEREEVEDAVKYTKQDWTLSYTFEKDDIYFNIYQKREGESELFHVARYSFSKKSWEGIEGEDISGLIAIL